MQADQERCGKENEYFIERGRGNRDNNSIRNGFPSHHLSQLCCSICCQRPVMYRLSVGRLSL